MEVEGRIFSSPLVVVTEQSNHKMPQKHHNFNVLNKLLNNHQIFHQNDTVIFNVEETLLRSSSMFPYFMLVAFEGGGPLRALILLLLYPFLSVLSDELGLKVMVFVCFFGIKTTTFRIGKSVLPKYFLEDVGLEGFEVVNKFGRKVGVTKLPRVMVESFLVDYLGVNEVFGGEIKVAGGYYLGLLMDNNKENDGENYEKDHAIKNQKMFAGVDESQAIGIGGTQNSFQTYPFKNCKDIYMVSEVDKEKWHPLPREKYPTPLVFHDGRLAFKPTPISTLAMFMWLPFGIILCITRILIGLFLPYHVSTPILAFIGMTYSSSSSNPSHIPLNHDHVHNYVNSQKSKGVVYVCNHKMVADPVYISYICRMNLTALTYSISKLSKLLAPIRTITLTRDREKDAEIMRNVLSKGSVVVCPEGTTCREPYLLRFSPLFAEISDDIIPLAIQLSVTMFYGTTASGIKALDPLFHILNPWPYCHVTFLDKLPKERTCGSGGVSKFEVANYVQAEIGKVLGYTCTDLTRKDKYLMLAGNTGVVRASK